MRGLGICHEINCKHLPKLIAARAKKKEKRDKKMQFVTVTLGTTKI